MLRLDVFRGFVNWLEVDCESKYLRFNILLNTIGDTYTSFDFSSHSKNTIGDTYTSFAFSSRSKTTFLSSENPYFGPGRGGGTYARTYVPTYVRTYVRTYVITYLRT